MYLMERPGELKGTWDLLKVVATLPGEEAFRPESEGNCKLVANKVGPAETGLGAALERPYLALYFCSRDRRQP